MSRPWLSINPQYLPLVKGFWTATFSSNFYHFMPRYSIRFFLACCFCSSLFGVTSGVDLDGNSASEIWELRYPGLILKTGDADNDGVSDWDEMIAGTDPTDHSESLRFTLELNEEDLINLTWEAKPGKFYRIEKLNLGADRWEEVMTVAPALVPLARLMEVPLEEGGQIYRLAVSDWDGDGDGVSAWEEWLLGWDDADPSSGDSGMSDYERAIRALEDSNGVTLETGEFLPTRLPSAEEAARFLMQTSFGPTMVSVESVMSLGYTGYFDDQVAMTPNLSASNMFRTGQPYSASLWRHGWWRTILVSDDQLRQRMAYALSQIFVVNNEGGSVIGDNILTQASYYDALLSGSFGSFRDVLNYVTYSPTMGFYLSHLNNRKSDPPTNRFPDENFAREVMQLFTIGLWKLNPDGSHELDDDGKRIPTYDNSVITEMAKIFTGMSNGTTMRGQTATSFYDSATGSDYVKPMVVWDEEHEEGEKVLFDGVNIPDGQTGDEDVQQTLDSLADHQNVGPFIGRLLIQRFTSSNPSPEYLRRVSLAWSRSDGDLEDVLRAVIFDPEARSRDGGDGIRGKVREPLIKMTHLMRAFAPPVEGAKFGVFASTLKEELGQFVMSSPSVFNFYSPDHSPTGLLEERGLVSPELQIATTSALLGTHDRLKTTASVGYWVRKIEFDEELMLVGEPEELLNRLDLLLAAGMLSSSTRAAALDRINGESHVVNKVSVAVQTIVTSPDFSVLK
jgi:uncharacterized protein (DUF1800 family)